MSRSPLPPNDGSEPGFSYCRDLSSAVVPSQNTHVIAPFRTVGFDEHSALKASFWRSTVEEASQAGDLDYVSIAMNLGGGRVWRAREATPTRAGEIAMHPFEGAHWRFEPPVDFVKLYLPFRLVSGVCESLFERELTPAGLSMPTGIVDESLCGVAHRIQSRLRISTPTSLLLDSYSLLLAERVVAQLHRLGKVRAYASFGKLPERSLARVVDYIEANLDHDLRLAALANVSAMSLHHFARRFKETVGASPHAYVLSRRLDRARGMLQQRNVTLAQVAAACGFSSQAHMTTTFSSAFGVTPGKFRNGYDSGRC
jgi:AraC family transcriptional regulator